MSVNFLYQVINVFLIDWPQLPQKLSTSNFSPFVLNLVKGLTWNYVMVKLAVLSLGSFE